MSRFNYFQDAELSGLDDGLCVMLDRARGLAGVPFTITCGLRNQVQNDALPESVKDSAHLTGHAVDLACTESGNRYSMVRGLILAGFNRIGIYSQHIHADNSAILPQNMIWYVQGT